MITKVENMKKINDFPDKVVTAEIAAANPLPSVEASLKNMQKMKNESRLGGGV